MSLTEQTFIIAYSFLRTNHQANIGQQTHAVIVMSPRPTITCRVSTYLLFFSDRCHSVTMHSTLIKHSPLVVLPPARPLTELDEQEALHCSLS